jgi:hypothetical protein
MAKRFTDTEKWKKPFIRGLQGAYKLLWLYICDDCDNAGIWQVDIDVAQLRIGEDLDIKKAIAVFGDKIISFDNGNKWFIPSFIEFQYPSGLNPENKAHGGVIRLLDKYKLLENKPLKSPLQGDKDMDMDKEIDKDKDKDDIDNQKEDKKAPKKEDFMQYVRERCASVGENYSLHERGASIKYDAWVTAGWKDGYGNKINNWKSKIVANLQYFKAKPTLSSKNGTSVSGTYEPEKETNYDKIGNL